MTEIEKVTHPALGMKVFHEKIYNGQEMMEVVGIRKTEVELEGDFSGGTNPLAQKSWMPLSGLFRLVKVCPEYEKHGTCTLNSLQCSLPACRPYVDINENKI